MALTRTIQNRMEVIEKECMAMTLTGRYLALILEKEPVLSQESLDQLRKLMIQLWKTQSKDRLIQECNNFPDFITS